MLRIACFDEIKERQGSTNTALCMLVFVGMGFRQFPKVSLICRLWVNFRLQLTHFTEVIFSLHYIVMHKCKAPLKRVSSVLIYVMNS